MGEFLREYWIWILAPIVLVVLGVVTLILLGGGDSDAAPFQYAIF